MSEYSDGVHKGVQGAYGMSLNISCVNVWQRTASIACEQNTKLSVKSADPAKSGYIVS